MTNNTQPPDPAAVDADITRLEVLLAFRDAHLMSEEPPKPGVYELLRAGAMGTLFSKWTGTHWCVPSLDMDFVRNSRTPSVSVKKGRFIAWREIDDDQR